MKSLICILCLLFPTSTYASSFYDGNEFSRFASKWKECELVFSQNCAFEAAFYTGFVIGIVSTLPDELMLNRIVAKQHFHIVYNFMEKHTEVLYNPADSIIAVAIICTFKPDSGLCNLE